VVPFSSLRGDLMRRCRDEGIAAHCYRSGDTNQPAHGRLRPPPENVAKTEFATYLQTLAPATGCVRRIVFDECHTIVIDSEFRGDMKKMATLAHVNFQKV